MRFFGKLRQNKRGVGSIIGATFLVFILLSGFAFYILSVDINEDYTDVLQTIDQLDLERKQENVEFVGISTTNEDKLNVTVRNAGSHQTHVIWLGIFDETVAPNTQEYHKMDVYINPAETLSNIPEDNITIFEGQERVIQLVTELGNTFSSNYPLREEGGTAQSIITITGKNCTAEYNPSQWNLLGSTEHANGSISDLASNDSGYAVFRSYYSGSTTDTSDAVDNNSSNVDGLENKGTHSNFTATQYGSDGVMDTLTEASATAGGNEQWVLPTGYDDPGNAWSLETNAYDNNTGTSASSSMDAGSWSQYLVLNHSALTCGKIRFYVEQSHVSVNQVQIDVYNGTWVTVYAGDGPWGAYTNVSFAEMSVSQIRFRFYNSHSSQVRTAYVYEGHFLQSAPKQNYELDLEIQWTSVDYSQANEWLCIYGGTMGAESLRVDVWNGSAWDNVFASLASGWNNVSVSSYLTSSNFTIRFKGTTETGDIVQDSWNVDIAFLHLWTISDQYTAEVEFAGSSNLQTWTSLLWRIQSCWDIGQVTVTIEFYNSTLGNYSTSGNGYLGYVSSATPNTNELKSQAEISSPDDFKNATGQWRVRIKGVKLTSTQFLFKVDWVNLETTYSTTGSTVPYNVWQWYTIRATTASGGPIPYGFVSIYANGSSVAFRNATDKASIANPGWVRLDARGEFELEIRSTSGSLETFVLYAVVGSVVGEKTITQEAP